MTTISRAIRFIVSLHGRRRNQSTHYSKLTVQTGGLGRTTRDFPSGKKPGILSEARFSYRGFPKTEAESGTKPQRITGIHLNNVVASIAVSDRQKRLAPLFLNRHQKPGAIFTLSRSKYPSIIGLPPALTPLILPMVVKAAANATRLWFSSKSEATMGVYSDSRRGDDVALSRP